MAVIVEKGGRILYSVSDGVGQGSRNVLADVALVQYFLSLMPKVSTGDGGFGKHRPLGPPIHIDGHYGPQTHYWSLYFMTYVCEDIPDSYNSQAFFQNHLEPPHDFDKPMARLMDAAETALGAREWSVLPESPRTPFLVRQSLAKKPAEKGFARAGFNA
jgi:hypothetical protein